MTDAVHRDQLPLPDYDHLPTGSLEGRIRSLDEASLRTLLTYEQEHGNRLPVVQLLERRIDAVAQGAELSGGSPDAATPEVQEAPATTAGGARVEGPPVNPPSHGDPTNPAQPRS